MATVRRRHRRDAPADHRRLSARPPPRCTPRHHRAPAQRAGARCRPSVHRVLPWNVAARPALLVLLRPAPVLPRPLRQPRGGRPHRRHRGAGAQLRGLRRRGRPRGAQLRAQGPVEASIALSLSPTRRMFRIIWPQAWAIMLPSLSNLGIMLLKGTAVASVVYMQDITFIGGVLRQRTNDTFFSYGVTMVMYFVIAYVLVLIANALEVRAKRRLGMAPAGTSIFRPSAAKTGVS